MKTLSKYFNFYIYANIHVAGAAWCLTKITLIDLKIEDNVTPIFVLLSTIISYNFIRYVNINKIKTESSTWIRTYKKKLLILNMVCFTGLVLLTCRLSIESFLILLPFILATFFYVAPIKILKLTLRDIPGIKLFLIAISWAGVTTLFPIVSNELQLKQDSIILFMERFFFIVAITIPFDIRDIDHDSPSLYTLPQVIGIKKSKVVGLLALTIFVIITFYRTSTSNYNNTASLIIAIIAALFVIFSNENQSKYYSNFWIESLPILWLIIMSLMIN